MMDRPWQSGKFLITAGLRPLEDKPIFMREANRDRYLENKKAARRESLAKYYPMPIGLSDPEMARIASVLRTHLNRDLPELVLDKNFEACDEVDFIISQVPEDFSVWKAEDDKEWLALVHLSSPNHWDAREKIGRNFLESHLPVPHIDPLVKASLKMFEQVQKRGAVERFAWGVATDDRLNHHPEPAQGISQEEWKGRSFDPENPRLFIRIERQTLFPIDEKLNGFTIKTTFTDISKLPSGDIELISQCIRGMDEEILKYKGLHQDKNVILDWLDSLVKRSSLV